MRKGIKLLSKHGVNVLSEGSYILAYIIGLH